MGYIEGTSRDQVSFRTLDDMVGEQSMVRVIDRFIDVLDLEALGFSRVMCAGTGRRGYSPDILTKLYVYGYENGIRSSRRLERECRRNIEVMWLMGELVPDHTVIAEFRRLNIGPLQRLFSEFMRLCRSWGDMVGGELVAIDGTKIKASNNKKNNHSRKQVEKRLARLNEEINALVEEYLEGCEEADCAKDGGAEAPEGLLELLERKELYGSYLAQMDASGADEISTIDPDARMMATNRGGVDTAYNMQSTVDAKHHLIVDFDVITNPTDQGQLDNMTERLDGQGYSGYTGLFDKGYYNGECLRKAKERNVTAIVARQRPPRTKGRAEEFRTDGFDYDREVDAYTCPAGATLPLHSKDDAVRKKYYNKGACRSCAHVSSCCPADKRGYRVLSRGEYADIYDDTDRLFKENKELYGMRMCLVEHPFGTIKRTMDGGYFLLRTLRKVRNEAALLCLGYNLKRAYGALGFKDLMARLDVHGDRHFSRPGRPNISLLRRSRPIRALLAVFCLFLAGPAYTELPAAA